jgi:hypothetical protein
MVFLRERIFKGYILLQPHSNEIIIRRDVKFVENILACKLNSAFVRYMCCEPSSAFVPSFVPILVSSSSSDDDSEDENTPLPSHLLPNESIKHEPTLAPSLLRWVRSRREEVGDLVSHPSDQCRTCS